MHADPVEPDKCLDYSACSLHLVVFHIWVHSGLDLGFGEGSHNRNQDPEHASLVERHAALFVAFRSITPV